MPKLIDSSHQIIATGSDSYIIGLYRVLLADPEDVSEADEIEYEYELKNLKWIGNLTIIIYE